MAQPGLQQDVPATVLCKRKEMEAVKRKSKMHDWKLRNPSFRIFHFLRVSVSFLWRLFSLLLSEVVPSLVFSFTLYSLASVIPICCYNLLPSIPQHIPITKLRPLTGKASPYNVGLSNVLFWLPSCFSAHCLGEWCSVWVGHVLSCDMWSISLHKFPILFLNTQMIEDLHPDSMVNISWLQSRIVYDPLVSQIRNTELPLTHRSPDCRVPQNHKFRNCTRDNQRFVF